MLPAFGKATASRTSWLARRGNVKTQHLARATQSGYKVDLVGLTDVLVWQSRLRLGNLARSGAEAGCKVCNAEGWSEDEAGEE